jgi:hypothetical protein
MRSWHLVGLIVPLSVACHTPPPPEPNRSLDARRAGAIQDSVRVFAATVAQGVSRDGPAAWRAYFVDGPAFFMVSEGKLVFPSGDSAARAIQGLTRVIARIELRWGDPLRVDPLAPGLAMLATPYQEILVDKAGHRMDEAGFFTGIAEHRPGGWQFRDGHWSVARPATPPRVP